MTLPTRFVIALACLALSLFACGDEEPEPDSAETLLEQSLPYRGSWRSSAVLAQDDAAFVTLPESLERVASGGQSTTIMRASRIHEALATDGKYVYFATQQADHDRFDSVQANRNDSDRIDGAIYRVSQSGKGEPEKLVDVAILSGPMTLRDGHLYVCESPGMNGNGGLLDVTLDSSTGVRHYMRFNEYCEAVIADDTTLLMAINARYRTVIYSGDEGVNRIEEDPKVVLLATADRESSEPWSAEDGPKRVGQTTLTSVDSVVFVDGAPVLLSGQDAIHVAKDGSSKPVDLPAMPGRYGSALLPDKGGWIWSINSGRAAERGKVCFGGRLNFSKQGTAPIELTQNVCTVGGVGVSDSWVWFVDYALIDDPSAMTSRFRVKRVARP